MRTLALALLVPLAVGPRPGDPAEAPTPAALQRVVFVGASVSAGFGAKVAWEREGTPTESDLPLAEALAATVPVLGEVYSEADLMLFTEVVERAERVTEQARAKEPTCVVALDYLFWFAYGAPGEGPARALFLEEGLERLARFEVPVIVGDLPDVRDAKALRSLPYPRLTDEELAAMRARLSAWAAEDERRTLVPLAALVDTLHADAELELAGARWPAGSRSELLSKDELHATAAGMVPLARLVALSMIEADLGLELEALVPPEEVPERILERLRSQPLRSGGIGLTPVGVGKR